MPCPDPRHADPRRDATRRTRIAAALLLGLGAVVPPAAAIAAGEVAGPIEIGPSWGTADAAHSTARLSTRLRNQGDLADRLIRAECPASGRLALQNGTVHRQVMAPNATQAEAGQQRFGDQNGLDVPPAVDGTAASVRADFLLDQAEQPLTEGAHVPCTLVFAHDGERIVVFTLGAEPPATAEP